MDVVVPTPERTTKSTVMEPVGPWATGRVDWNPEAGLVGVRPVVDQYSMARYDVHQWKERIDHLKQVSCKSCNKSESVEDHSTDNMKTAARLADKNQDECKGLINGRALEIHKLRTDLSRSIDAVEKEMRMLQDEIHRIKRCIATVDIAGLISNECIKQRGFRLESDLVHDPVQQELAKEYSLINEVRELLVKTLGQFEEQLARNESVKSKLEWDWSNKREAYDLETTNVGLNTQSTTALFKPGSVRFPENGASVPRWTAETETALAVGDEACKQSAELRLLLNNTILIDCIRDLRLQCDRVDLALSQRIQETEQSRQVLQACLEKILNRMSTTEGTIRKLKNMIRNLDQMTKVAQSRLDNRNQRPPAESTRDEAHVRLVDEVKTLLEQTTTLENRIKDTEAVHQELYASRKNLEQELQVKLKTLWVDRERCQPVRAHYPSVAALSGHGD
nr:PREDICTED: tektin-4 [Bemisia tabaci]